VDGVLAGRSEGANEAPTAPSRAAASARAHLVVLALLALLPSWGLAGFAAWRYASLEQDRLFRIGQDAARDIATSVEREVAAVQAGLAALSTSPAPATSSLASVRQRFPLLHAGEAGSVTIEPAEPGDRSPPAAGRAPRLERDVSTGRFVVLFRQPLSTGSEPRSFLTLRTDAIGFWSDVVRQARLPQGWVAAVLDPDAVILARYPDPQRFVGLPVHPDALTVLRRAPTEAAGGWGSGSTRQGAPVRIAWRRIGSVPWTVLVGIPVDAIDGALRHAVLPVVAVGVPLLLAMTGVAAYWATRRFERPLRALAATAEAVGRRAMPEPPVASGVREIDAAGLALVAAAARLDQREAEIAALAARLEAVLESTTDCVVVLDRSLTPLYLNGRARAVQWSEAGSGGGLPLAGGSAFAEAFERAFRTGLPVSVTAPAATERTSRWFAADAFPSPQGLTVFFRDVTAARQAEQAVRASEALLQAVLDHVPVGVALAEAPSGRMVLSNRRLADILGMPAVQAASVADYARFPAVDAEGQLVAPERRAIALALRGERHVRREYRFRRADGRLVWVRVLAAPIRDAEGGVSGAVAAVTEIEAEREAEAALRESELRFRALAEAVPQIVWSCDPGGRIDYLNPRFFEFTGTPRTDGGDELPIHPEDRRATGQAWRAALASGEPYEAEYRLRRADGAWRWFVARSLPVRDAGGAILRWIGTATDVTELIETRQALERQVAAEAAARQAAVGAAEALAASEARFRGFAEASPDLLWMLDPASDRLAYLSPAYVQLWGKPAPEPGIVGLEVLLAGIEPEDAPRVRPLLPRMRAGEPVQVEFRIRRADGQLAWLRLTSFATDERGGQGARVGGFARDITRRRESDERQRLLIAELNHRVKNTLATVLSLARQTERRSRRGEPAAEAPEAVFVADFQARLMALARAHDLLTASTWRGAMLHEVAAASLSPWRDERRAGTPVLPETSRRIAFQGPTVWLAPRQALGLSLAIHEMATNAAKHGALRGTQGRVAFTWTREPDGWITACWVESDGPRVQAPAGTGFGTRLLRSGLGVELGQGATIALDYPPEGFRATMRFQPLRDGGEA